MCDDKKMYDRMLEWRGLSKGYDTICTACNGSGVKSYASTSTWVGGYGGSMMTTDVCNKCWGTGKENQKGVDLRAVIDVRRQNKEMLSLTRRMLKLKDLWLYDGAIKEEHANEAKALQAMHDELVKIDKRNKDNK